MTKPFLMILCLAVLGTPTVATAQAATTTDTDDAWHVDLVPYAWFASLRGELTTIAGLPPFTVDNSASQVLEDLDSAFMFVGQVRKGRYGGWLGFIYSSAQTDGRFPSEEYSTLATDTENYSVDVAGFYRGWTWEQATIDAVGGARIWTAKLRLELGEGTMPARTESEDQTWVDPMVGGKGRYTFGESGWYASGFAYLGGFGVGSKFMWDVDANLGFQWLGSFSTLVGYRYLDVNYEDGSFIYDVAQDGLVLAAAFSF